MSSLLDDDDCPFGRDSDSDDDYVPESLADYIAEAKATLKNAQMSLQAQFDAPGNAGAAALISVLDDDDDDDDNDFMSSTSSMEDEYEQQRLRDESAPLSATNTASQSAAQTRSQQIPTNYVKSSQATNSDDDDDYNLSVSMAVKERSSKSVASVKKEKLMEQIQSKEEDLQQIPTFQPRRGGFFGSVFSAPAARVVPTTRATPAQPKAPPAAAPPPPPEKRSFFGRLASRSSSTIAEPETQDAKPAGPTLEPVLKDQSLDMEAMEEDLVRRMTETNRVETMEEETKDLHEPPNSDGLLDMEAMEKQMMQRMSESMQVEISEGATKDEPFSALSSQEDLLDMEAMEEQMMQRMTESVQLESKHQPVGTSEPLLRDDDLDMEAVEEQMMLNMKASIDADTSFYSNDDSPVDSSNGVLQKMNDGLSVEEISSSLIPRVEETPPLLVERMNAGTAPAPEVNVSEPAVQPQQPSGMGLYSMLGFGGSTKKASPPVRIQPEEDNNLSNKILEAPVVEPHDELSMVPPKEPKDDEVEKKETVKLMEAPTAEEPSRPRAMEKPQEKPRAAEGIETVVVETPIVSPSVQTTSAQTVITKASEDAKTTEPSVAINSMENGIGKQLGCVESNEPKERITEAIPTEKPRTNVRKPPALVNRKVTPTRSQRSVSREKAVTNARAMSSPQRKPALPRFTSPSRRKKVAPAPASSAEPPRKPPVPKFHSVQNKPTVIRIDTQSTAQVQRKPSVPKFLNRKLSTPPRPKPAAPTELLREQAKAPTTMRRPTPPKQHSRPAPSSVVALQSDKSVVSKPQTTAKKAPAGVHSTAAAPKIGPPRKPAVPKFHTKPAKAAAPKPPAPSITKQNGGENAEMKHKTVVSRSGGPPGPKGITRLEQLAQPKPKGLVKPRVPVPPKHGPVAPSDAGVQKAKERVRAMKIEEAKKDSVIKDHRPAPPRPPPPPATPEEKRAILRQKIQERENAAEVNQRKAEEKRHERAERIRAKGAGRTIPVGPKLTTTAKLGLKPTPTTSVKAASSETPKPSRSRLTIPVAPKLSTLAKYGTKQTPSLRDPTKEPAPPKPSVEPKLKANLENPTDLFKKSLRQSDPSPQPIRLGERARPTQPKPFHFHESKIHLPADDAKAMVVETPADFAKSLRGSTTVKREMKPTVPVTPKFSKISTRGLPKSSADQEAEMMEYYKKHPFKAKSMHVEARSREPPQPPAENGGTNQFKAKPVPNFGAAKVVLPATTKPKRFQMIQKRPNSAPARRMKTPEPFRLSQNRSPLRVFNPNEAETKRKSKANLVPRSTFRSPSASRHRLRGIPTTIAINANVGSQNPRQDKEDVLRQYETYASSSEEVHKTVETAPVGTEKRPSPSGGVLSLIIRARDLKNVDGILGRSSSSYSILNTVDRFWGQSDPFFRVVAADGRVVAKSEVVSDDLNPDFAPVLVDLAALCQNNLEVPVSIEFYDWEESEEHKFMGKIETTVQELLDAQNGTNGTNGRPSFELKFDGEIYGKIYVAKASVGSA